MMKKSSLLAVVIVFTLAMPFVFADGLFIQSPLYPETVSSSFSSQLGLTEVPVSIPNNAVLLAIGNKDYPVTPGDSFSLSYSDGKTPVVLQLRADSDSKVVIPAVGVIDASGMTYREFKLYVEELISKYYTYSSPQLSLLSCGVFSVRVTGEVSYSQYVTAWGLSRLSDLAMYATDLASARKVVFTYPDGTVKTYDLFNALRNGSESDNPLLVPGCEISFTPAEKIVSLGGAVKRAGVYQPVEGDTLYDIISVYGNGLLSHADPKSITVAKYENGSYNAKTISLEEAKSVNPANGDVITVSNSTQSMPFVTVTGAVASTAGGSTVSSANRLMYSFLPGETAQQLIRNIASLLLPASDTDSVYILRDGNKIPVDVSDALSSGEKGNEILKQGDTVVIPFSQLTVTVLGAVINPGTFSYVPDRGADYYINLAGGFSDTATRGFKVMDRDGKKINSDIVPADSTIMANRSNTTANIAIAASVLSIISTVLTIIMNGHTIANY